MPERMLTADRESASNYSSSLVFVAVLSAALFLSLAGCSDRQTAVSTAQKPSPAPTSQAPARAQKITLESLEQMFENMRNSKMDTDGELLWGYFFTDPDPKKLERLVEPLTRSGYRVVSIYPTDDGSTHFLHVERIEKHTPTTLHARNTEFYRLADEFELESYDGMDVGPVLSR